jgi:predicted PurR-regulated permease PerM
MAQFILDKEKKRQQNLVYVFIFLIVCSLFIIFYFVFGPKNELIQQGEILFPEYVNNKDLKINLEALNNPILKELKLFKRISPFEGQLGKENPFVIPQK